MGGALSRKLLEMGHEVVALVRHPEKASSLQKAGARLAAGDITDKETMRIPMSGVDGVFHVAGWYKVGVRDSHAADAINVTGTRNVLEVMNDLGVKKGVYTSTLGVFSDTRGALPDEAYRYTGPHLSEYDRTKWAAHYEVAEPMIRDGLPLVIVMPGIIFGPGDTSSLGDSLRRYLRGKLPSIPRETAFCWAHIDDVVEGHILAMEKGKPGETYILAGPPHTVEHFFEIAERITGVPAPRLRLSPGVMRFLSRMAARIQRVIPLPPIYTEEALRVTAGVTYLGTNEKARRELGYTVRPLENGLRETLVHEMRELGIALPSKKAQE